MKKLFVMFLALAVFGTSAALNAATRSTDLGDAIQGAYFNARNAATFVSVVNTSSTYGVLAKVRFREGKYSNETLDFVVCLSAGDRWTFLIYGDDDPDTPARVYLWDDDTVTYPGSDAFEGGVPFSTAGGTCVTDDMAKEGEFEIIGLRAWNENTAQQNNVDIDSPEKCYDFAEVCYGTQKAEDWCVDTGEPPITPEDVPNVLFSEVRIYDLSNIDSGNIRTYAYNTWNYEDCNPSGYDSTPVAFGADSYPMWGNCDGGIDAVNVALTKTEAYATYDLESMLAGNSGAIIAFPTKRETLLDSAAQHTMFNLDCDVIDECYWTEDNCTECIDVARWDDEENNPTSPTCEFSPCEPEEFQFCLPYQINYITYDGNPALLNTILDTDLDVNGYDLGWLKFNFRLDTASSATRYIVDADASPDSVRVYGMPVIGFELNSIFSGTGADTSNMLEMKYVVEDNATSSN